MRAPASGAAGEDPAAPSCVRGASPGTRLPTVLLLAGCFLLPGLVHAGTGSEAVASPRSGAGSGGANPVPTRPHGRTLDVDSARAEIEAGRFWHAARHLRRLRSSGVSFGPEELLLLARADAGWRNWDGVADVLGEAAWLEEVEGGTGLLLLARSREALGSWGEAARRYGEYLASPEGRSAADRPAIEARLALTLHRSGRAEEALARLDSLARTAGAAPLAAWTALELARESATAGDTLVVRRLVEVVSASTPEATDPLGRAWELGARAHLVAGDTAAAAAAYEAVVGAGEATERVVVSEVALAELALAARAPESVERALRLARSALDRGTSGPAAARAAEILVELDALDPDRALRAARILDRRGDDDDALGAYDAHVAAAGEADLADAVRLARARLMARTPGRRDEAVQVFRALSTSEDAEIGAGALESWADLRRSQGRTGDVATLRGWLLERYPSSPEAVEIVFLRGDAAQDRGELETALRHYDRLQEVAPTRDRSGLARMRTAQIHLLRGDSAEALRTWRGYLEDFPEGRRWEEATYWAGVLLLERGRPAEGRALLERILDREPVSFYAVLAADRLGVPYGFGGMADRSLPDLPSSVRAELRLVDLLEAAGLEEGRDVRVDALVERGREIAGRGGDGDHHDVALRLAGELIERGFTLEGIRLGWHVRGSGAGWSLPLLRTIYPFPYRETLDRAARARGLDPIFVAAIVRQESAFDPAIVSSAGAVGLMQVMPPTGRELARAVGPEEYDPGALVTPEINLHLGTRFLVELWERYEGDLNLVLSAYNAGPSRANRWRRLPEATDELRFIERIPFGETRAYVKLVRRNMALYRALWGEA